MERSFLHKIHLIIVSKGAHRNVDQRLNLVFIQIVDYQRSFLHRFIPNIVSMGVHRNDDEK